MYIRLHAYIHAVVFLLNHCFLYSRALRQSIYTVLTVALQREQLHLIIRHDRGCLFPSREMQTVVAAFCCEAIVNNCAIGPIQVHCKEPYSQKLLNLLNIAAALRKRGLFLLS